MMTIKLIVGVGNPGPEYELTRHNIAWPVIDEFLEGHQFSWKKKFKGEFCQINFLSQNRIFLKPLTYMNLSGESVVLAQSFFKVKTEEILVIHDEVDLEFGSIQFKSGGGLAGHNGLKSIASSLGGQSFHRLRVGVSRPKVGQVSSWVLSKFKDDQLQDLGEVLKYCHQGLKLCLDKGVLAAQKEFNKRNIFEEV